MTSYVLGARHVRVLESGVMKLTRVDVVNRNLRLSTKQFLLNLYQSISREGIPPNPPKASTNRSGGSKNIGNSVGNTSDVIVLDTMSELIENMVTYWKCGNKGHYEQEC